MSKKDVKKAVVEDAQAFAPEPPRPLMRELPPADPFPVDVLSDSLADVAKAIHDKTQAPMAICAQSVLAAFALAVQGHADVELPTGQVRPLSCFFLSIADSGERKSACDAYALEPIRVQERSLRDRHDAESLDYTNKKHIWEQSQAAILKGVRKNAQTPETKTK